MARHFLSKPSLFLSFRLLFSLGPHLLIFLLLIDLLSGLLSNIFIIFLLLFLSCNFFMSLFLLKLSVALLSELLQFLVGNVSRIDWDRWELVFWPSIESLAHGLLALLGLLIIVGLFEVLLLLRWLILFVLIMDCILKLFFDHWHGLPLLLLVFWSTNWHIASVWLPHLFLSAMGSMMLLLMVFLWVLSYVSTNTILNKLSDIGFSFSLQSIYCMFSWVCHKHAQGSNDLERLLNWHPLVIRLVHV